jgi:iron-sulfur cluster repair protein YtfE (RIC family)
MTDTRIRAPRATDLLRDDHRRAKRLFDEFSKLGKDAQTARERAFERLHQELTIHARVEEEIFYPALGEDEAHEDALELLEEAAEAHEEIAGLLEELSELDADDKDFDLKMRVLRENVERHAEEEERELFPYFLELDDDVQEDVAERLRDRRAELAAEDES